MPQLNAALNIIAGKKTYNFLRSQNYTELFSVEQTVDNSDAFIKLAGFGGSKAAQSLEEADYICMYNVSDTAAEISLQLRPWTAGSPDTYSTSSEYVGTLLRPGEYLVLPNHALIHYSTNTAAAKGTEVDDKLWTAVNSSNMYSAEITTTDGSTGTGTSFSVVDGKKIKVGDILQILTASQEYVRVSAISDTAADGDYTPATVTVERGLFGGVAATNHSTGSTIRLPMWNQNAHQYNKYSVVQTDSTGNYLCTNLWGDEGRTGGGTDNSSGADGWVPSSIAIKWYQPGYQEFGLAGLTANTKVGLTASTAYQLTVNCDAAGAQSISFTTDASDLTLAGSNNAIIPKIQAALDTEYYTTGSSLKEKKVSIGLVGGDIRVTSGQRLSTSAISLGDSGGGDTDLWGVGRIPAVGSIETAVAARLPNDTNIMDGLAIPNLDAFTFDNGYGVLYGVGSGTIDYNSGSIKIKGAYPDAEFSISGVTGSALGGAGTIASTSLRAIIAIRVRSTSPIKNSTVQILAFN